MKKTKWEAYGWMIASKYSEELVLPDLFRTKQQAELRLSMNKYQKIHHCWKVIKVIIKPASIFTNKQVKTL